MKKTYFLKKITQLLIFYIYTYKACLAGNIFDQIVDYSYIYVENYASFYKNIEDQTYEKTIIPIKVDSAVTLFNVDIEKNLDNDEKETSFKIGSIMKNKLTDNIFTSTYTYFDYINYLDRATVTDFSIGGELENSNYFVAGNITIPISKSNIPEKEMQNEIKKYSAIEKEIIFYLENIPFNIKNSTSTFLGIGKKINLNKNNNFEISTNIRYILSDSSQEESKNNVEAQIISILNNNKNNEKSIALSLGLNKEKGFNFNLEGLITIGKLKNQKNTEKLDFSYYSSQPIHSETKVYSKLVENKK